MWTIFLPALRREGGVEGDLQTLHDLVLKVDGGGQLVVGVPLLGEGQAVLLELVLGLQVSGNFAGVGVGGSAGSELNAGRGLGLELQLEEAEVVALAEDIAGVLAEITVGRGRHLVALNEAAESEIERKN